MTDFLQQVKTACPGYLLVDITRCARGSFERYLHRPGVVCAIEVREVSRPLIRCLFGQDAVGVRYIFIRPDGEQYFVYEHSNDSEELRRVYSWVQAGNQLDDLADLLGAVQVAD